LVIITARDSAEDNAERIGADAYLEKPFDIRALLQKLAELIPR
jgi:DNA-binding response OmpR family regulator